MEMRKFIRTTIREYINETKDVLNDYIEIEGIRFSTRNSNGDFISSDVNSIINFYKWFNNSKTLDKKQRPMIYYHTSNSKFNIFKPSKSGKMGSGIYFTSILSDIKMHNKFEQSVIYSCYLKIENPLEIENPFSKRNDNNDGIIAFKGKSGEEIKIYNTKQVKSIKNDGTFDLNDDNIYS